MPREGKGCAKDGKHYWLTPPDLMNEIKTEFSIDYDPCPYPRPDGFDGLCSDWGSSSYVNPPFSGPTAWVRKCIRKVKKARVLFLFSQCQSGH